MRIGKYCIELTEFEPKPWIRVELEYEKNSKDNGFAYVFRGWLWFVVTYREVFGWKEFQKSVKKTVDEISNDNNIFKL